MSNARFAGWPIVALCAAVMAAVPRAAWSAPRLVCEADVFDFGERASVETVQHAFRLENRGDADLRIERIRACCGATAALSATVVAQGGTAVLDVNLSLLGRSGPQKKSIYIVSDDPAQPYFRLTMVGHATATIEVRPDRVEFGEVDESAVVEQTVRLTARSNTAFRVRSVAATPACFDATVRTIEEGKRYELTVRTVPPLPSGFVAGGVEIVTDIEGLPPLTVSVVARVDGELVVVPRELAVQSGQEGAPARTRYLALRRRSARPFRILEVGVPFEQIETDTERFGPHGYRIGLSNLPEAAALDGRFVTIRTDVDGMEEIDVPFRLRGEP